MSDLELRRYEFGAGYENFEHSDIVKLIVATGDWLEHLLFDPAPAEAAMKALFRSLPAHHDEGTIAATPWRRLWEEVDMDFDLLLSSQYFVSLNAFAFGGLRPDLGFFGMLLDRPLPEVLEAFIGKGRKLIDVVPAGWADVSEIERTVLAAEARIRIDTKRDVTPEQLAALAHVSLKSIKNLLTPKGGKADLKPNNAGMVPGAEALRWLQSRPDFKTSLWQRDEVADADREELPPAPDTDVGEVIFVPVARDGSWFDPAACRNSRHYTIGPKGAEQHVPEYREAVARLSRMPTPYWRRPNEAGNWGIVAGVSWQRKVMADLAAYGAELEGGEG